ncbi:hypothetical protein [Pseudoxanthomonas koreensis]|uniref:hypothetical protein n=1 Tax=Pseudoxanthomonas koreensis TaxID=266061 RepID=UPI001391F0EC|nr:hypothetical protein [Pseudoxanthomonas koreensis]KAF1692652.1 hypothetical protein CSC64_06600 [Pseudoxanthomonas koreensis]
MSWAAVGGAVVGGAINLYGQKKADAAQQKGIDQATAEQRRQFDLSRQDQQPWLHAGQNALTQLQALNSGDFSSFNNSPDYQFARDQGLQGLDRSAAARGGLWSGGADADRMQYASGLATQNYGNYYNRLSSLAGLGQTTASGLGTLGQGYANNMGNLAIDGANARASGYQNQANTLGQLAYGAGGAFSDWYQGNKANNPGGTPWYLGNNPGRG